MLLFHFSPHQQQNTLAVGLLLRKVDIDGIGQSDLHSIEWKMKGIYMGHAEKFYTIVGRC